MTPLPQKIRISKGDVLPGEVPDHLEVIDEADARIQQDKSMISSPIECFPRRESFEEAKASTFAQYDAALRRLADAE